MCTYFLVDDMAPCEVCYIDCEHNVGTGKLFSVRLMEGRFERSLVCMYFFFIYACIYLNFLLCYYTIYLICIFDAQTLPCNVRVAFNKIVGNAVEFRALGQTYDVDIHKKHIKTHLAGEEWRRFITQNNITPGVHLFFAMGSPGPRINVVYFDETIHFDEGGDEEGD